MLYHLIGYMNFFNISNIFAEIPHLRLLAAAITSLSIFFLVGRYFIIFAQNFFKSPAREYTPESHKIKAGTPSMGGIFIIGCTMLALFFWSSFTDKHLLLFLWCLISFGLLGLWDDISKIIYKKGISEKAKSFTQLILAASVILLWFFITHPATTVCLPFLKNYCLDIGYGMIPWAILIVISTSNAVNLTDGLDGLAITIVTINFATLGFLAYGSCSIELMIGLTALIGSCLGFLYYNRYPAQIFMGDSGSLSLGATLGFFAIITGHELLLPITGCICVLETLSVIIQVVWYKLYKKRFFKRAPVHHHFELLGWHETSVTGLFIGITILFCIMTLLLSVR